MELSLVSESGEVTMGIGMPLADYWLHERKVGRDDNTQGHSVGPLRVGSLDRYRNSSLSLRIIDILIQLQADVLQPRFSQLISAIWLSAVTLHLPWVFLHVHLQRNLLI